jgi:putative transposase
MRTIDSRHDFPIAPNLLERNFTAAAPNRIWSPTSPISRPIRAGAIWHRHGVQPQDRRLGDAGSLRAELPLAALHMAISVLRPGSGLIHHSDRGVQYASAEYRNAMQSAGFRASMSRKADCDDNAPMELLPHAQDRACP